MKLQSSESGVKLWLSAHDTYEWAHKSGATWPCSFLSARRLFAEFDRHGDLVDLSIDGGRGDQDCPSNELNAIVADHVRGKLSDGTWAEIIVSAKLSGGSGLRDIADTQVSYLVTGDWSASRCAQEIAKGGREAIDCLVGNGCLTLTTYSNPEARYTCGHGIVVKYPSGRLVAIKD